MSQDTQQLLRDLSKLVGQIESAVHAGTTSGHAQGAEAIDELRAGLKQARARVTDVRQSVEDEIERGVDVAERLVRNQPWLAIGIVAAAAFALGLVIGRRD